jgi:hypothetical protein
MTIFTIISSNLKSSYLLQPGYHAITWNNLGTNKKMTSTELKEVVLFDPNNKVVTHEATPI